MDGQFKKIQMGLVHLLDLPTVKRSSLERSASVDPVKLNVKSYDLPHKDWNKDIKVH